MGIATGIDIRQMLAVGARAEELLGRSLRSNFLLAGPVPHRGREYDKNRGIVQPAGAEVRAATGASQAAMPR
jgi:hypothetical protein